jgi:hypothetical protein
MHFSCLNRLANRTNGALFTLLCFFLCTTVQAIAGAGYVPPPAADSLVFPASWEGDWAGKLDIFNAKGLVQRVDMEVNIHKIDTSATGRYTFGLMYGSRDKDWRPYELVPVAPEKGLWKVDEKSGIILESYLYGPKLLCWFVVNNSRVLCTYEKTDAHTMIFEVYSGTEVPVSITGNTKQGTEEIPEVKTYPFIVFQRAVLNKK